LINASIAKGNHVTAFKFIVRLMADIICPLNAKARDARNEPAFETLQALIKRYIKIPARNI
jgi:hypothetical protein